MQQQRNFNLLHIRLRRLGLVVEQSTFYFTSSKSPGFHEPLKVGGSGP